MIEFESVGKTFRDGTAAVVDLSLTVPSDKITVIVGPSGCGKTTTLRMVEPDARAHQRTHRLGRDAAAVEAEDHAAAPDGLRDPERRAVPAPDRAGEHRHRSRPAGLVEGQDPEALSGAAGQRRAGPQAGQPLSGSALRRSAAAGGRRPRLGGRPVGAADGRAVLGGGPGGARRAARVLPGPAARAQQDDHPDHPRHRRGHQARRPGGDPAGRWPAGPGRRAAAAARGAGRRVRRGLRRQGPRVPLAVVPARAGSPPRPGRRGPRGRVGRVGPADPGRRRRRASGRLGASRTSPDR